MSPAVRDTQIKTRSHFDPLGWPKSTTSATLGAGGTRSKAFSWPGGHTRARLLWRQLGGFLQKHTLPPRDPAAAALATDPSAWTRVHAEPAHRCSQSFIRNSQNSQSAKTSRSTWWKNTRAHQTGILVSNRKKQAIDGEETWKNLRGTEERSPSRRPQATWVHL